MVWWQCLPRLAGDAGPGLGSTDICVLIGLDLNSTGNQPSEPARVGTQPTISDIVPTSAYFDL